MARVEFDDVHFSYPVFNVSARSLKVVFMERVGRGSGKGVVEVHALRGVSFALNDGDRLGLIGRNGSGKSTILRLVAGLAHPQRGRVETEGRKISLIEIGLGVNPELTGFENIELPMRLLGASSEEVARARSEIPEFTGLGDFMRLPVRTYSAGMRARLAFALCTSIYGDILVMDEWLGTGDAEFVHKAQNRLAELVGRTKILVLASHSPDLVKSVCNKAAWMEGGRIERFGDASEVADAYLAAADGPHGGVGGRLAAE